MVEPLREVLIGDSFIKEQRGRLLDAVFDL